MRGGVLLGVHVPEPLDERVVLVPEHRAVADDGRTVLFSSHLLDEVERVADVVAILRKGRLP